MGSRRRRYAGTAADVCGNRYLIVLAGGVLYVFPVLAKFDNTVFATIKNALGALHAPSATDHSMMIATYGLIYFTMQYVGIMFISIPLIFYIDSFIFSRILQQYVKKDEADTDEL